MKKRILAFAAATFCAAFVSAQTSEVNKATAGLIGDDMIDNLAFGTEKGEGGIVFAQFDDPYNFKAGFGNWFSDSLWISVYDSWNNSGRLSDSASVTKTYGTTDGVNIDYIDEEKTLSDGTSSSIFNNTLGVGLNFGVFGAQILWDADWTFYDGAYSVNATQGDWGTGTYTTSYEDFDTPTGTRTAYKYDNIQNFMQNNIFTVNFKGAGVENLGAVDFYAKLNKVSFGWYNTTHANDYSNVQNVNGADTTKINASLTNITQTLAPGLEFELGLSLPVLGVIKPSLAFTDSFGMGFKAWNRSKTYTSVVETATQSTTATNDYSAAPGSDFDFANTLTPKFICDFDLGENLTLKAQVSAAIGVVISDDKADTYTYTNTVTRLDKTTGAKTVRKTTVNGAGNQNTNSFTTSIAPDYAIGLVYKANPGKLNLNLGAHVERGSYQWDTTTVTNANINTVTTTEQTDEFGNVTGSKAVAVAAGGTESKTVTYRAPYSTTTSLSLGTTWFISDSVKLDAYYSGSFTSFFTAGRFGLDLCVMF